MSEANPAAEQWLSVSAAARRLNVHANTLRRWADDGQIAFVMTPGGHRRFALTELQRFISRQQNGHRPVTNKKEWVETAVTATRQELAGRRNEPWLRDNDGTREQHRQLGRQLMGLVMQYLAASDEEAAALLAEAGQMGRRYGQMARQSRLPLAETLSAAAFFRDTLIEAVLQLPEHVQLSPEATARLMRKINDLLNEVQLTIAEEYDAFIEDILSRN